MVKFSNDVDILKYEPTLFGELHLPWQVLIEGLGASLSGTTLTANNADFNLAKVSPGGVIYLSSDDGTVDGCFEIVSVDLATQLTVSILRSDESSDAIAPPSATDITYRVSTYEPQAAEAGFALTEYFSIKPGYPASEIDADDIVDKDVLKQASVFAVLMAVYAMLASKDDNENFWKKSYYYKECFAKARARARVSIDTGEDGIADATSSGGSVKLIRD